MLSKSRGGELVLGAGVHRERGVSAEMGFGYMFYGRNSAPRFCVHAHSQTTNTKRKIGEHMGTHQQVQNKGGPTHVHAHIYTHTH